MPIFELPKEDILFPDPNLAEADGLLAVGGDLSPERLLTAYSLGIFPWYNEGEPILWWSLDPRLLCFPKEIKFSKSLMQIIKQNKFEIRIDTDFKSVIRQCATVEREKQEGTWLTEEMMDAYCRLHELGFAHSFETYLNNRLVGGLYGVSIGRMFAGESMFHLETNASKVAFYYLIQTAIIHNFTFIDCQQETAHLLSLGARPVPRTDFLDLLAIAVEKSSLRGKWEV